MVILKAIWSCAQLYTPAIVVMKTELLALLFNVMEEGNNGSNRHTGYKKVALSLFLSVVPLISFMPIWTLKSY